MKQALITDLFQRSGFMCGKSIRLLIGIFAEGNKLN